MSVSAGASKIFIFGHPICRITLDDSPDQRRKGPHQRVHVDQSYNPFLGRVFHHLPEEDPAHLKGRAQNINVRRPIKKVLRDPLPLADPAPVLNSELVAMEVIHSNRRRATYNVRLCVTSIGGLIGMAWSLGRYY